MGRIFLSYAREDRARAELLARVIEQAGHDVWWDRHIDSGEEFADEIEAALAQSDIVLVAWSKISVKSRWVRDEAAVGGDTGRLVPVSIDGTLPPMGFRQFHTMDLAGWKGNKRDPRTAELLQSVERRLKTKPIVEQSTEARLKRRPRLLMPGRRWIVGGIAIALVIAIVLTGTFMFIGNRPDKPSSAPTIALLPFTSVSPDPAVRQLALEARDTVVHDLSDSGVPVKLINSDPASGRKPADYLMSAEFSDAPDKMVATVRLEDAGQGVTVWSSQIEADRQHAADLPDRVGAQIAGSLTWAGMIRNLFPDDPNLTAKLLQQSISRDPLQNYQQAQRVASQSPNVGIAQLGLAMYTAFALSELPRDQRTQAVSAARQAAARAKALIPHFGDVYIPGCLLQPPVRMALCEDQLRLGLKADPDAPFVNFFLSELLRGVGRNQESGDRSNLSYQHDPYMPAKLLQTIKMLEIAGDTDDADSLAIKATRWWPDWPYSRARIFGTLERGDFEALGALARGPEASSQGPAAAIAAIAGAVKARSIPLLRRSCAGAQNGLVSLACMLGFAKLDDQDSAYAIADVLYPRQLGRTVAETEQIWLDKPDAGPTEFIASAGAAPMRRDPRFLQLAQRTGLLAYWRSGRPPDFCRKNAEPICGDLLKRN
jgi:TolB-like protein